MGILDQFSLKGKVAIVTGASTGLGQGMCLGLADAGADIVGVDYVDMPETKVQVEALGKRFYGIKKDLINSKQADLVALVEEAVKAMGHVDILVNNAGIIKRQDALEFSESNWDDVMNINSRTVFFLSQACANQFVKQQTGGKIISVASMLAYQGGIRVPSYTASKSAVKGITMAMANEWAKYNINVNAIAPGYMATNNTKQLRDDETRAGQILERIPAGRWGLPSDMMGAIVFLASDASSYVNGFTLAVDGGWLAR
ncbi:2-dehydro-3-deoxy-D-gluconate 5-dehydrogenase KduD [Paracholeplasma manati]|jgi:2-deoxy-D-gluconate 3-dehydrogenase|uniref:2-dehydro-3-deoxy-D-gluconate 5-dehydrogenase KduD n=1 Tax=Paracholeplasma manati TaxID=591373 RepID=A0ABT2Y688_9MOLU|nr:2-dehydro-3-deoxy-D-gluconate 5-dehydrogenase KduD [Paracholeplasma manati]MCV2232254.1 2-dehydro-3-deoxy-D-gluconate 5-dehydrogenase KduD [Paracholeplasma manati]MDG0888211.1 2-dehydro-3-deoxy-D-gluconate 5-dehydrogenase KduD [Paracholeplasma manati]MDX9807133.1 2-dehydro-3-deoxy-D-gluconate 5-dehydrogenase KduD [Acholeplasma sp.]